MLERVVGALRGEAERSAHGESLEEAALHDYSTSKQGIVPLDKRRPIWHFAAIFFTLEAAFAYIFLGFTLNEAGFTLPASVGILVGRAGFYIAYGAFAPYLGSRTGLEARAPLPVDLRDRRLVDRSPPVAVYVFAMIFGIVINGIAGWIMAQIAGTSDFGPAMRVITTYSLFGAFWLAFVIVVLGQWSVNDGNYYEVINAGHRCIAARAA